MLKKWLLKGKIKKVKELIRSTEIMIDDVPHAKYSWGRVLRKNETKLHDVLEKLKNKKTQLENELEDL